MKRKLMIGLAEADITPGFSTALGGYRLRDSEGVHDRLHASCVVLATSDCKVAMLSVPVVSIGAEITASIRKGASAFTGIGEHDILIHATHTHSAPVLAGVYKDILEKACIECISAADANLAPGCIGFASTTVAECGKNRCNLDYGGMPVDPEIGIMMITDENKRLKAVIYNYACHCTVLGADNKLITKDWPYFADDAIKNAMGEHVHTIFIQGASGDINPGYSAGLSAVCAKIPTRTWAEAERIGNNIGRAVLTALKSIEVNSEVVLKSRTGYIDLPTRTSYPLSLKKAEAGYAIAGKKLAALKNSSRKIGIKKIERAEMAMFFASLVLQGAKKFHGGEWPKTVRAELQAIVIDDCAIATFPGEVFHEIGIAVKSGSPAKTTLIAGLSNTFEAKGYLPTPEAFEQGDYEVFDSYYAENAATLLTKASLENIRQVYQDE